MPECWPGTPPLVDRKSVRETDAKKQAKKAALVVIQRASRKYLMSKPQMSESHAAGRPVLLGVSHAKDVFFWCDFTVLTQVYCDIRVLRKPFGPNMFEYTTEECNDIREPKWEKKCFAPMLSSKCDIVVTLIGITAVRKRVFLGQCIFKLHSGWETQPTIQAPIGKWIFPTRESLLGCDRHVRGSISLQLVPMFSNSFVYVSPFTIVSGIQSVHSNHMSWWRKSSKVSSNFAHLSMENSSIGVGCWGVLTYTHLNIYAQGTAAALMSFQVDKLQIVSNCTSSTPSPTSIEEVEMQQYARRSSGKSYPLRIYAHGELHVLHMSSHAQLCDWIERIAFIGRQVSQCNLPESAIAKV
uniref:Uncharacterized protein AlNc14C9G1141 n=1 Tax=Albugo laibachii Nc14 TaxID=890382 RepID=F0W268_9STRA|nr:conserved hypothetical protein [Albugo laibachii Nc14]|eukprot:CCA15150.1 conserved hypothetical protein [Albugo laibachii Nc14]